MSETPVSEELAVVELDRMLVQIQAMAPTTTDADRIDRIRRFELLKSAVAAAQLVEAVAFDVSQRAGQAVAGVPPERQGRGVAEQLGLATQQSPWHARRWLGWGKVLTSELPVTFAQLRAGRTTERRALLMAQETVWLSREDRAEVDAELGPQLPGLGDRRVENQARAMAQRLDPAGAVARRRVAESERRVSLRPRPDTMSSLTATTTVERGVAMWATLRRDADALVGTGQAEGRTRYQVMADLCYERLTGRAAADGPSVEVELIISADSVVDDTDEPALLGADGIAPTPVPAPIARQLIADAPHAALRRLFSTPDRSTLVAMESHRREFPDALRDFLRYRDQVCTTPHCGAPIRHADHALPAERGGVTSAANGNGKCAGCNWAKQALGWQQRMGPHGRGMIITPTGHTYLVRPPRPPGRTPGAPMSPVAELFWNALQAA